MEVGVALAHPPSGDPSAGWRDLAALAGEAESLGLDAVWLDDRAPPAGEAGRFDALTAAAALSRTTTRVRLGVLGPLADGRPPGIVAKALATIDVLSGGRLVVAMAAAGQGGDAAGGLGESLAIQRGAFTGDAFDFVGRAHAVAGLRCLPRPVQRPGPPLWVLGSDESTVDAAAAGADGWLATGGRIDDFGRFSLRLDDRCGAFGRDPASLARSAMLGFGALGGEPAEALAAWASAGASHLVVGVQALPFEETRTVLRLLASATR